MSYADIFVGNVSQNAGSVSDSPSLIIAGVIIIAAIAVIVYLSWDRFKQS